MKSLDGLILAYLNDQATPGEVEQLFAWIHADPENAREFARTAALHAHLRGQLTGEEAIRGAEELSSVPRKPSPCNAEDKSLPLRVYCFFARPTPLSMGVAALAIGLVITAMAFMAPPFYRAITRGRVEPKDLTQMAHVATFTGAHEVVWGQGQADLKRGENLSAGQSLTMRQGLAEVTFASGARVVLQGPASFVVDDAKAARLTTGGLTAYAPPEANGFSIVTPSARVVDLGTEFGIDVTEEGSSEVVVLDGEVECFRRDEDGNELDGIRLTKGEGASVSADGSALVKRDVVDPNTIVMHRGRGQLLLAQRTTLYVNIDTANNPLGSKLPDGYHTYTSHDGGATVRRFTSPLAVDGSVDVEVVSPFFRNANKTGYGTVTSLHPSGDPLAGYNAVVNSGALVNHEKQGPLAVVVHDLRAGEYGIRFFLHGTHFRPGASNAQGRWEISGSTSTIDVPTSFGFNEPADAIKGIAPDDLSSVGQAELRLKIVDDGDTATFTFTPRELAGNLQLWVNGFELTVAKEVANREATP